MKKIKEVIAKKRKKKKIVKDQDRENIKNKKTINIEKEIMIWIENVIVNKKRNIKNSDRNLDQEINTYNDSNVKGKIMNGDKSLF